MPNTRNWVFEELLAWATGAERSSQHHVFWIKGDAGMGKSVTAREIIERYDANQELEATKPSPIKLVAYWLCNHHSEERYDARKVVATLAFQLATTLPEYGAELLKRFEVQRESLG